MQEIQGTGGQFLVHCLDCTAELSRMQIFRTHVRALFLTMSFTGNALSMIYEGQALMG